LGDSEFPVFLSIIDFGDMEDMARLKAEIAFAPDSERARKIAAEFATSVNQNAQQALLQIKDSATGKWREHPDVKAFLAKHEKAANKSETNAAGSEALSIIAEPRKSPAGGYRIHFSLRNISPNRVTIFTSQLPWDIYHSSANFILRTDSGALFEFKEYTPGFPAIGDVLIEPSETIEGTVEVSALFPQISKLLEAGDAILYWSYWVELNPEVVSNGRLYGGALVLPGSKVKAATK
jgi:hypothetical protein